MIPPDFRLPRRSHARRRSFLNTAAVASMCAALPRSTGARRRRRRGWAPVHGVQLRHGVRHPIDDRRTGAERGTDIGVRVIAISDDWRPRVKGEFQKENIAALSDIGRRMGAEPISWHVWTLPRRALGDRHTLTNP